MYARVIDKGRRRKVFVRFRVLPEVKQRVLPTLFGICSAVDRCGPGPSPVGNS